MTQIKQHNFVMEQGVPCSVIIEYNKEVQADDLFAVVRMDTSDEEFVAKFNITKVENVSEDAVSTFKLTLGGDIPQGRHVYDVFVYDQNNKPKYKILKGHILVKGSVSDRGRLNG
ncbi:MAG: hypothetical protein KH274_07305 [Veillonella sp. oral taxon 780]|jgi:hypothetical protein|nr:hypothetical protein [Veillonella sp. oral taxon 780]DAO32402.1 MAG TPA: hypothetical protein [Caudoviricetes sp.]